MKTQQHAAVASIVANAIATERWNVENDRAQPWLLETWQDLASTGGGTRTRPASLPTLLIYYSLSLIRWLALAGIGISLLHWFLRGSQIGTYKRMLARHEAGRCPDCNYDISAHPDAVCPECGCDHRARRREAIAALRHAGQWPIATQPPTETGKDN
ncbi:MAG: hypothetical protein Q9O74_10770 [Planctomycetota bacterium]|nr:hypothetical protein [Planctomycetota bacterium]